MQRVHTIYKLTTVKVLKNENSAIIVIFNLISKINSSGFDGLKILSVGKDGRTPFFEILNEVYSYGIGGGSCQIYSRRV